MWWKGEEQRSFYWDGPLWGAGADRSRKSTGLLSVVSSPGLHPPPSRLGAPTVSWSRYVVAVSFLPVSACGRSPALNYRNHRHEVLEASWMISAGRRQGVVESLHRSFSDWIIFPEEKWNDTPGMAVLQESARL
ncbi:hypothetical protein VULLAG_LOCUS9443 [Vulpes lagopus]